VSAPFGSPNSHSSPVEFRQNAPDVDATRIMIVAGPNVLKNRQRVCNRCKDSPKQKDKKTKLRLLCIFAPPAGCWDIFFTLSSIDDLELETKKAKRAREAKKSDLFAIFALFAIFVSLLQTREKAVFEEASRHRPFYPFLFRRFAHMRGLAW
jgi:hypothetical protein